MSDFFEIDFLDIESAKSGDAIPLRYEIAGKITIHVVDGGFQDSGDKVVDHIRKYYGRPSYIHRVIVTHPDGDHAGGLRKVLEEFDVGEIWMLRPWQYAEELINRFSRFTSVENLRKRLKAIYPNLTALEEIADEKGIPIYEPFQGAAIGMFTALAPSKPRFLDLVVESEKTPESIKEAEEKSFAALLGKVAEKVVAFVKSLWGDEVFSEEETSAENEMSVVQYAQLCGKKILLTGDAGRAALNEASYYALAAGLTLPGINRFQVPHHGSRRNVSTEILDRWLGRKLDSQPAEGAEIFTAIVSASEKDKHHPRKAVVRAMIHRGAKVVSTEGSKLRTSHNAPDRDGWNTAKPLPYPDEQEE